MNVVDPILFQCRLQASTAAMCAPGAKLDRISYGRLEQFIRNIGRNARMHGLQRGNVVALRFEEDIVHAAFILGLTKLGIVTVSASGTSLPKGLKVDAILADQSYAFATGTRFIVAGSAWTEGDGHTIEDADRHENGSDLCRIVLTSGTTGDPKAVALTREMTFGRMLRHNTVFGSKLVECSRVFVDMRLTTSLGFLFLVYTLSRGGTVFFRGPDAVETLQALDLYKIQCMVAPPAALAEFVEIYERAPTFPMNLEVIITAGSLLSKSLSERARARLCSRLVSVYGATETSMIATALAHSIAALPGAVGYLTPGVAAQIVNGSDEVLRAGEEGLVRVRSEFAVDGYFGDGHESMTAFRDGWFYPGDIGQLGADQMLIIAGREKTILNLGGDKVNPERIEQVLVSCPGVTQAAVFGELNSMGIEEVVAAVVAPSANIEALRAHCEQHLTPAFVPLRFLHVADIPRTEAGKVDRVRLAQIAASP